MSFNQWIHYELNYHAEHLWEKKLAAYYTNFRVVYKRKLHADDGNILKKTWKLLPVVDMKDKIKCINTTCISIHPVLRPKLTLIQPTWSAYPYHLVFLIWYPYSLVFLIWYPYALISLYGNTAHCSGCGVAMGCYGLSIVARTAIVTSQWYDRYCFAEYARTWARHPATPWQRECTAITDFQSIPSL